LIAQLKLQEETNSETSQKTGQSENGVADLHREKSPEDGYTHPSSIFSSNGPHPRTISPIYSSPAADLSIHFNSNRNRSSNVSY
uniref:Ovule protein n=1 Tax=Hymenolepis diminuta TaxID=6216 RepID=A0A0R3SL71_HYMDI